MMCRENSSYIHHPSLSLYHFYEFCLFIRFGINAWDALRYSVTFPLALFLFSYYLKEKKS